ncbi:hypothetical protein LX95_01309 [Mesonia algae]|uniref:Uncharacterized protein n=1 Tax=Mesonia algae TaxID=213248 RepID=A0A2W7I620_9FLAO|nr:hypothetical protein [Mesonia algae]PZW41628.1 hypothetical protein LX95_01309 [Mesonia algae]
MSTLSKFFVLGLILQILLTTIFFFFWGVNDNAHAIAVIITFLAVAGIPLHNYYLGNRTLGGKHFLCGVFGMFLTIVATLLLWF